MVNVKTVFSLYLPLEGKGQMDYYKLYIQVNIIERRISVNEHICACMLIAQKNNAICKT